MSEPRWLNALHLQSIHDRQIQEHGGSRGVRSQEALEGSLGRVQTYWSYHPDADMCQLAAILGHGICSCHAFVDGNKRTCLLAMHIFLGLNGFRLKASEPDAVRTILSLAQGLLAEDELSDWLRVNTAVR